VSNEIDPVKLEAIIKDALNVFPQADRARLEAGVRDEVTNAELWMNSLYQVNLRVLTMKDPEVPPIVHLSIKRRDKSPCHDWRDLQAIKNQLVGPECEAVEIYPAESRLVDTANQYHLWAVADPTYRFPFGWNTGRVVTSKSGTYSKQRPIKEE
jgi:hypothetical protein